MAYGKEIYASLSEHFMACGRVDALFTIPHSTSHNDRLGRR